MQTIPIADVSSQTLSVQLGGQSCSISIYLKSTGLFCNLSVANALIIGGVICQNVNRIVRDAYLGFVGDLVFLDTQGTDDPTTPGLGSRYFLVYLDPADIAAGLDAYGASLIGVPPVFPLMSVPRPALPFFMASGFAGSVGSASLFLRDALAAAGVTPTIGTALMVGVVALAGAGVASSTGSASLAVGLVFAAAGYSAAVGAAALTSQSALRATGTSTSVGTAAITSSVALMAAGTSSSAGTAAFVAGGISAALNAAGASKATGVSALIPNYAEPNFSSVSLLLHMEGANGGTTFTDSSSYARTPALNNNATTSTAQAKFGNSAGLFPGTAYLIYSHTTALEMSTGDWTIEGFVYVTTLGSNSIITIKATGTGFYPWQLYYNATGNLVFQAFDNGTPTLLFTITSGTAMATGAFYHWAITRSGSTFTLWLNGVSQGTATSASALYSNTNDPVLIGSATGASAMTGYLDEYRITKGVARYTGTFTPPTFTFADH